jgi:tetratricopeptide (TPR) repeat protein
MRFEDEVRQDPDRARRREQLIWSAGLDARRMLEAGVPEQVIDQLLRQVHRFRREGGGDDAATDSDLLPLHLLLARAYQDAGRFDESLAQYQWAQRMLPAADPRQAQVMVGLGEVELAQGADAARQRAAELFESARRLDPHGPRYVDALIGLGDLYAVTGERFPEAVDALGEAAAVLNQDLPDWDPRRQRLLDVLDAHVRRTVELERYDQALVLLGQMLPMYGADGLPRRLVEQGAVIEEALGDAALQRAASLDPSREQPGDAAAGGGSGGLQSGASGGGEAFRMANQEAAEHYRRAAEHYSRLASMSVHDDQVHGEALWSAARNYDRAQAWERAIETYIDFVTHRGTDGRQIEASHQLALALLADGQVDAATQRLETLIREHPNSPWALASYVPLSRALEQRGQLAEAEARLRSLLARDQTVTPESDVYREALIELGRLSYERGEQDPANFARAVEVLHEAVQRFGDSREGASLRYMLGDALRRSALSLDESASARRSQRERLAYQSDRSNRLEQAEMYYDQAITLLEAVNAESLTPLERLRLRHAYLYKADCAFERGAYQIAIDRYRAAAQQYEQHPASLVALVQIVNAHCELGQYQEAAVANRQALWQLDRMPDDAFDDPSLPMTRQHWEDWLRWSGELGLYEDAPPVRSREDQRLGAAG